MQNIIYSFISQVIYRDPLSKTWLKFTSVYIFSQLLKTLVVTTCAPSNLAVSVTLIARFYSTGDITHEREPFFASSLRFREYLAPTTISPRSQESLNARYIVLDTPRTHSATFERGASILRHNAGLPKMRVVSGSFSLFHWLNNRREDPWIHSHRYVYTHFNDRPLVTDSRPKAFREIAGEKKKYRENACESKI